MEIKAEKQAIIKAVKTPPLRVLYEFWCRNDKESYIRRVISYYTANLAASGLILTQKIEWGRVILMGIIRRNPSRPSHSQQECPVLLWGTKSSA